MFTGAIRSLVVLVFALLLTGCGPEAEELWSEHCASCHGDDGSGVEPHLTFYPLVDLTSSELVADQARGPIYQRITYGWGAMPGFDHKLRHSDIERLVEYSIELGLADTKGTAESVPGGN